MPLVGTGSGFVSFRFGLIRSVVLVSFLVPLLCRVVLLDLFESGLVEGNAGWNAASAVLILIDGQNGGTVRRFLSLRRTELDGDE